jgi:1-acyl-sn-glycerol-3-phosphate acyltransferase
VCKHVSWIDPVALARPTWHQQQQLITKEEEKGVRHACQVLAQSMSGKEKEEEEEEEEEEEGE